MRFTCRDCGYKYTPSQSDNKWCDQCSVYRLHNMPRNEPTKIEKKPRPLDIKEWNKQATESNQRIIEKYKLVNK